MLTQNLVTNAANLIGAVLVFIIGWLIAKKIKGFFTDLLNKIRLNQMAKSLGWEPFFDKYDTRLNVPKFFGAIIELFFVLLFLTISFDILGLAQVNAFLLTIINYFPNIFISMLIFIFAVFVADFSKKIVLVSLNKEKITYSGILGDSIAWITWIMAILAILYQLNIVPTIVLTIFIGFVALIVIVFGLAFGLGGREFAKKILEDLENRAR